MYMTMCKEIAAGDMKIKHHITEYTKTPPKLRIPIITKVDMASQTNVTKKVTETTQIIIRIPRWVLQMRNTTKAHRDIRINIIKIHIF